ncbi:hypothetical protein QUF74_11045 [Candidatus Halobeggiatoa sp. HSG11]|nr:hypothetical protein [Candidatus Halobeggiatoa sp. HSG11]
MKIYYVEPSKWWISFHSIHPTFVTFDLCIMMRRPRWECLQQRSALRDAEHPRMNSQPRGWELVKSWP